MLYEEGELPMGVNKLVQNALARIKYQELKSKCIQALEGAEKVIHKGHEDCSFFYTLKEGIQELWAIFKDKLEKNEEQSLPPVYFLDFVAFLISINQKMDITLPEDIEVAFTKISKDDEQEEEKNEQESE